MDSGPQTGMQCVDSEALDVRLTAWLGEMADGNEQALSEFYDATLGKVYGVAIRVIGDSTLAEDVVTDVYHHAWNNACNYQRERGSPLAWLLTICRNRALDCYRHESSAARTIEAAAAQQTPADVDEPDDLLQSVEEGHAVHAMLATISTEDRQLIALAFFRGMTHQQISEVTAMPLRTVKSRIRRALGALSEAMPAGMDA